MAPFFDLPTYTSDRKIPDKTSEEKELCTLRIFKNDAYLAYEEKSDRIKKVIAAKKDLGPFRRVFQVNFQINNTCNYASVHTVCPVHYFPCEETLPTAVVYKVIDELSNIGYFGMYAFSIYNEAMGDSRFFDFCRYAKGKCPDSRIFVNTNGSYLNQKTLRESKDAGVDVFFISAYSVREYRRFLKLETDCALCVYPMVLDRRLEIYDRDYLACSRPCYAPYADLSIDVKGNVILCCLDHRSTYVYGNVATDTLKHIISSEAMDEVYSNLLKGKRVLEICRRCDYSRR
jgi:radical SAM protein with 4Fe4S-binding SPASM domain